MEFSLSGHAVGPVSNGKAKSIVLFLHGLGSNGDDLIALAPYFAKELPDTIFISPNAPEICDMAPPGYENSFQWFSLQDRDPHVMETLVKEASPKLDGFIDEILDHYKVSADKLVLVGFSQGTMMSLFTGLNREKPLAGIIGFSGALMNSATDLSKNKETPILLVHGEQDDVVPYDAMAVSQHRLKEAGCNVETLSRPDLAHSIDEVGLKTAVDHAVEYLKD